MDSNMHKKIKELKEYLRAQEGKQSRQQRAKDMTPSFREAILSKIEEQQRTEDRTASIRSTILRNLLDAVDRSSRSEVAKKIMREQILDDYNRSESPFDVEVEYEQASEQDVVEHTLEKIIDENEHEHVFGNEKVEHVKEDKEANDLKKRALPDGWSDLGE